MWLEAARHLLTVLALTGANKRDKSCQIEHYRSKLEAVPPQVSLTSRHHLLVQLPPDNGLACAEEVQVLVSGVSAPIYAADARRHDASTGNILIQVDHCLAITLRVKLLVYTLPMQSVMTAWTTYVPPRWLTDNSPSYTTDRETGIVSINWWQNIIRDKEYLDCLIYVDIKNEEGDLLDSVLDPGLKKDVNVKLDICKDQLLRIVYVFTDIDGFRGKKEREVLYLADSRVPTVEWLHLDRGQSNATEAKTGINKLTVMLTQDVVCHNVKLDLENVTLSQQTVAEQHSQCHVDGREILCSFPALAPCQNVSLSTRLQHKHMEDYSHMDHNTLVIECDEVGEDMEGRGAEAVAAATGLAVVIVVGAAVLGVVLYKLFVKNVDEAKEEATKNNWQENKRQEILRDLVKEKQEMEQELLEKLEMDKRMKEQEVIEMMGTLERKKKEVTELMGTLERKKRETTEMMGTLERKKKEMKIELLNELQGNLEKTKKDTSSMCAQDFLELECDLEKIQQRNTSLSHEDFLEFLFTDYPPVHRIGARISTNHSTDIPSTNDTMNYSINKAFTNDSIKKDSTNDSMKKAYKDLAKFYHPDRVDTSVYGAKHKILCTEITKCVHGRIGKM